MQTNFDNIRNALKSQLSNAQARYEVAAYDVSKGDQSAEPRVDEIREEISKLQEKLTDLYAAEREHFKQVEIQKRDGIASKQREAFELIQRSLESRALALEEMMLFVSKLGSEFAKFEESRRTAVEHLRTFGRGGSERFIQALGDKHDFYSKLAALMIVEGLGPILNYGHTKQGSTVRDINFLDYVKRAQEKALGILNDYVGS